MLHQRSCPRSCDVYMTLWKKLYFSNGFNCINCSFVENKWRQYICSDLYNFFVWPFLGVYIPTHSAHFWEFPSIPFEGKHRGHKSWTELLSQDLEGIWKKVLDLKWFNPQWVSVLQLHWESLFFFFGFVFWFVLVCFFFFSK